LKVIIIRSEYLVLKTVLTLVAICWSLIYLPEVASPFEIEGYLLLLAIILASRVKEVWGSYQADKWVNEFSNGGSSETTEGGDDNG
jgi:hypothetical protein